MLTFIVVKLFPRCMLDFSSWNMMHADLCSQNLLHVDDFLKNLKISLFRSSRNLLNFYFFFVKVLACWFFCSWNLCIYFPPRETGFVHGTCSLLIFVSKISFVLAFFFVKLVVCFYFFAKLNLSWYFLWGTCLLAWFLFKKVLRRK